MSFILFGMCDVQLDKINDLLAWDACSQECCGRSCDKSPVCHPTGDYKFYDI